MYKVSIVNGDDEIIINEVSTNKHAPRILGTVKLGINTIDSFTFKIFFDNPGYNKIKPYATIVKVYNTLKNKYEFIGRPITPSKQMESSGVFYKEYICESVKGFMYDSMQKYKEWHNVTPRAYLEYLVEYHNNQVEDDYKKFRVGAVTVKDSNDSLYRYTSYESTYKNINDDLVNPLAGELVVRYGDGEAPWTLDLLEKFGEKSETKIKMGINMDSISEKVDFTNFGTRIIPLGAKIKTSDESGNEKETEERVTIESVNDGKMYIDLPELIEKYGIIEKIVSFDDVTLPENLIKKGKEYAEAMILTVSNSITAYDLSLAGYDYDSFEIGNYYRVEHEGLDIDYDVRLIEKQISIESPEASSLTFGDHGFDFKSFFRLKADSMNKVISGMISDIKKIPDNVLKQAQTNATELIKMCTSGNVVFHLNEKMKPYEILIMDTDDITTAKNVWRWNVNGFGFSSEGYNGTYKTAITMDGAFVADFITTGILSADLIRGGTFTAGGYNNSNGIIKIVNADNNVIGTWDVSGINAERGKIGRWVILDNGGLFADREIDGKSYRAWMNCPTSVGDNPSWIYSTQQSYDGQFYGSWRVNLLGQMMFANSNQYGTKGGIAYGLPFLDKEGEDANVVAALNVYDNKLNSSTSIYVNGDIEASGYLKGKISSDCLPTIPKSKLPQITSDDLPNIPTSKISQGLLSLTTLYCTKGFSVTATYDDQCIISNLEGKKYDEYELSVFGAVAIRYSLYVGTKIYGTVSSDSDRNAKHDIESLEKDKTAQFIYSLNPCKFKYNNGTSNRYHHGLIAQEVKESMGDDDWGLYVDKDIKENNWKGRVVDKDGNVVDEGNEAQLALVYQELIPDLIATVQTQHERISNLEKEISELKTLIQSITGGS